jgi:hypothetical protein
MKHIPIIVSVIVVAAMLFIFIDNSNKLQKHIIKNEQRTRDSLSQIYAKFVTKSDSLQSEINKMNKYLTNKINSFRYDLYKIRIIQIPNVNYSNDTILISRLLSGYTGR